MKDSSRVRPFLRVAVKAVNAADDKRLQRALAEIVGQDRRVSIDTQPNEEAYSLEGTAESDLDLICDRLRDEYGLAINVGPPQAILIQTIRNRAEAEGKYIRQTGGSGNYGHCKLRIEPVQLGQGYEFINEIRGGAVPSQFIKPINEGIQVAMRSGIQAGIRLVDVRVTLFDGSNHEVDSNEMAFQFAASIAFQEAAKRANPVLLEPMMSVELEVPEKLSLAVRDEIHSHRGRIEGKESANGFSEIKAIVPLSELLASASSGLTHAAIEFAGYEPVRDNGSPDDGAAGVTANKPNHPRVGSSAEMARWELDEEDGA
jgi:elongation factor G